MDERNAGSSVFAGYDAYGQPIYTTGVDPGPGAPGGMQPYYTALEQLRGMQPGAMAQYANVESGGDPLRTSDSGTFQGLFQLGPDIQKKYGVTNWQNPYQNADAAAQYAQYNIAELQRLNPTSGNGGMVLDGYGNWVPKYGGFDSYMAHQQGARGYSEYLQADPSLLMNQMTTGRQANATSQRLAGYDPSTWTVGDFLGTFQDRYGTASNGQPWGNYSYNQPFADSSGYPMGFGGATSGNGGLVLDGYGNWIPRDGGFGTAYGGGYAPFGSGYAAGAGGYGAGNGAGWGGFGGFGTGTPSTAYGVDNSAWNSINQMMPGIGGAAQWGTPYQTAELGFTVGGPSGGGGGGYYNGETWVDFAAPAASSLNGFASPPAQAAQNAYVNSGGIVPGTAAAVYGGGLTAQDANTQFANYQALQGTLQNYANTYQGTLNALPSSAQNYQSQIVGPTFSSNYYTQHNAPSYGGWL